MSKAIEEVYATLKHSFQGRLLQPDDRNTRTPVELERLGGSQAGADRPL